MKQEAKQRGQRGQTQSGREPVKNPSVNGGRRLVVRLLGPRTQDVAASIALGLALLLLAEIAAHRDWVSSLILPAPSAVGRALLEGLSSGLYTEHTWSTLIGASVGFLLAAAVAFLIAATLTSIPRLEAIVMPYIVAFQTLPKIALAPLIILWLGFDQLGKVTIAAVICFFPMLINGIQGLKIRDRVQLLLFRSLGASRMQILLYLRLPASLPYLFASYRVGIVFALLGTVVAEFVGSRSGLGYILIQQKAVFDVSGVFAIIFILMLIGLLFNALMVMFEKRLAGWAEDVSTIQL